MWYARERREGNPAGWMYGSKSGSPAVGGRKMTEMLLLQSNIK